MANTLKFGNSEWYGKKDTILAYNDENNNFKPLPFTFTRGSNATVVNKSGLVEEVGSGEPRVDYYDNTDGHLLLEPSRTNAITYSEDFTLGGWTSANVTVTSNYGTSPDGNLNSTKLVFGSGAAYINRGSGTGVGDQASSIYVKGISGQILKFGKGGNVASGTNFTLNGEWQRLVHISTNSGTAFHITSNLGGANATEIEVYGAQLEDGSYATSYIPTSGSSVTRVADACEQTVPDGIIGQTEGTMYAEIDFKSKPEAGSPIVGIMTLNNNVNNLQNCIILGIERQSGGINRFYPFVQVGNSTVAYITGGTLTDGNYKVAFAYKQNDFILYVNGVQIGTDTNGAVPTTSQVLVGERYNGDTSKIADGIKETKLYNTRLTNAELAALTTI